MNIKNRFISGIILGPAYAAQDEDEERSSKQKTKQAQAVSKEVYDRIEKAQLLIDEDDDQGALKILNALLNKKNITEYEQQNVLNYIGFVNYKCRSENKPSTRWRS